ncbi:MAG: Ppx/GppA family phosphatase [Deltaproteobacteria bacterium]|nr:Ppx/GppA family phosphatase [Deltaproteobacteria bacterium]
MRERYASIDIGTNTLRLLIAQLDGGKLKPLTVKRIITRLGGNFTEDIGIAETSIERTIDTLRIFTNIIKGHGVKDVFAAATSVVRRARNKDVFIKRVFDETGIKVNLISGNEEAELSTLGVLSVIGMGTDFKSVPKCLVIDIGGGSTEFILAEHGKMLGSWSMEMGVVHLTENYLKSDPPSQKELQDMEMEIERTIYDLQFKIFNSKLQTPNSELFIGTAGTITTLAAIDQNLETYRPEKINNYILKYDAVKGIYKHITSLTLMERQNVLSLEKGREDLIIPGTAIVLKAMQGFGFDKMTVSDAGLLEGILIKQLLVSQGGIYPLPIDALYGGQTN